MDTCKPFFTGTDYGDVDAYCHECNWSAELGDTPTFQEALIAILHHSIVAGKRREASK